MASTNKTDNLKLNQWVLTDPPLMEDFNEDNRKIDAAVAEAAAAASAAAAAGLLVKLLDVTIATASTAIELNLSGITITNYLTLRVHVDTNNAQTTMGIRFNKISTSSYLQSSSYSTYAALNGSWSEIDLGGSSLQIVSPGSSVITLSSVNPKNLSTIDIVTYLYSTYPAGTRFIVTGVKK